MGQLTARVRTPRCSCRLWSCGHQHSLRTFPDTPCVRLPAVRLPAVRLPAVRLQAHLPLPDDLPDRAAHGTVEQPEVSGRTQLPE